MKSIKFVCPLVLLLAVSQLSFAQNAGDLDTTFNSTGKYTYDYGFVDNATNVAVQPADQKIVVSGTALTPAFPEILWSPGYFQMALSIMVLA
ncbi:MAG: hypothetical protein IPL22_17220 [Bacteroidetes bacterium]|nr:hypothetical protein [Bacteroidota bacterium]